MNLFAKPAVDWTLSELRAGLVVLGQEIADHVERGEPTDAIHALALVLAEEGDRRVGLRRALEAILNPFTVVGESSGPMRPQ